MFIRSTRSGHRTTTALSRSRRDSHPRPSTQQRRLPRVSTLAALALACLLSLSVSGSASEEEIPILSDSDASAALIVDVEARCSEVEFRSPEAKFRWTVDSTAVPKSTALDDLMSSAEFRIDVSKFSGGLKSGRFDSMTITSSAPPPDPSAKSTESRTAPNAAVVRDLSPGVYYHARVLARTSEGWVASSAIGFISSVCPVDGLDED